MSIAEILASSLPHVFERFYKRPDSGGMGLSLGPSIAKQIFEALGGEITALSEPGAGRTICIRLPA
jgi:signal transduction histidine kinase